MWPDDYFGIIPGNRECGDLFLTEEPAEIDFGIYVADAVDAIGNHHEVELEGWDDGDFDFDEPRDID